MDNYFTLLAAGIGAVQSLLFAILIFFKRKHKEHDWLLAAWFLVFFIHLLLVLSKGVLHFALQEALILNMSFLHGPLFFFYVKSLQKKVFTKLDCIHFLPFVLFLVLSSFFLDRLQTAWVTIVLWPKLVSLIAYPVYVLIVVPAKPNAKLGYVQHNPWIRAIAILFLLSAGISILRMLLELSMGIPYFRFWDTARYVVLIIIIGFFGLRYGTLYQPITLPHKDAKKYKTSPLKAYDIEKVKIDIEHIFETEKPYLNPDFSLEELASLLGIAKHHLSQILNAEMHTNFYNLINQRRIEDALEKIKQHTTLEYTMEGIGYECGFSSKSSFFTNFKKFVGLTPGQYIRKISTA